MNEASLKKISLTKEDFDIDMCLIIYLKVFILD